MINRKTRLKWRRRVRHSRGRVEGMGTQAEEHLERHFFKRLSRLYDIRRFLLSWILLVLLLIGGVVMQIRGLSAYYLIERPVAGGTFTEGILGSFTNANPLYATGSVDSGVARLVFASLFKYDQNHQLIGDLAESYTVNEKGDLYTVYLKPNLMWQDDYPLTAADIVFTYQSIQNPDTKSPLAASWRGISLTAIDARTIDFALPNALSAFPYSLTNGIVPKHLLAGIPAAQLRSISFNTARPVGAGPFKWSAIEMSGGTPETREQRIALLPNETYHGGKPKLSQFIIRSFHDERQLLDSFNSKELNAMAGLSSLPEELGKDANIYEHNIPLLSEVMVFLKNSSEILQDVKVRQAITRGTDVATINSSLGYPVLPARSPLLMSHVGYDKTLTQLPFDSAEAQRLLEEAGWKMGADGVRAKGDKKLSISLYTQNNNEYTLVAQALQKQWRAIGVDTSVYLQSDDELQPTLVNHSYDTLLYGIGLGVDPDVFAYWHSSQANVLVQNRLNFSEYQSTAADAALEAGRTRADPVLRAIKYRPFLETWRNDAPGIALYQPRFLYVTRGHVFGFEPRSLSTGTDRYVAVEKWMIREQKTKQ